MAEVNLRALLKKYVQHVRACEGVTFIDDTMDAVLGMSFSDEEMAILYEIVAELDAELAAGLTPMDTLK